MGFLSGIHPDDFDEKLAEITARATKVAYREEEDGTYSIAWDVPGTADDDGVGLKSSSSNSGLIEVRDA